MVMFIYYLDFQAVFFFPTAQNVNVSFQSHTFFKIICYCTQFLIFKYVGTDYDIGKGR